MTEWKLFSDLIISVIRLVIKWFAQKSISLCLSVALSLRLSLLTFTTKWHSICTAIWLVECNQCIRDFRCSRCLYSIEILNYEFDRRRICWFVKWKQSFARTFRSGRSPRARRSSTAFQALVSGRPSLAFISFQTCTGNRIRDDGIQFVWHRSTS